MANLRGFIGSSETTINVDDTTILPTNSGMVQIGSEKIVYTNVTDTQLLGCVRGADGTVAATHVDKSPVTNISDPTAFDILDMTDAIAPTDFITGLGHAVRGSRYTNIANGTLFINTGSELAPVWELIAQGTAIGITQLTGDVTAGPGNGSQATTVATVGGSSSTNINLATVATNNATASNTNSTIVRRDGSGNFLASTITASLTGHASLDKAIATGSNYKWETTGATGDLQETTVTASRAVVTDANGLPTAATTTATELGYVNGVTSAIQTQLNSKQSTLASTVRVTKSAIQTINNDVTTVISWDVEGYDTANYHSNVTNNSRLTAPQTGYYRITSTLEWGTDTNGVRFVFYSVNGGTAQKLNSAPAPTGINGVVGGSVERLLNAADYVEILGRHGSAGNLGIQTADSFATMTLIGQ